MNNYEIRQLIENYYDIQKIRVETFNRIVCWIKENNKNILKMLGYEEDSQFVDETQVGIASHFEQQAFAIKLLKNKKYSLFVKKFVLSQSKFFETHSISASQHKIKTHLRNASHVAFETHGINASQCFNETQKSGAKLFSDIKNLIWFHNKLYETEKEVGKKIDFWSRDHPLRKEFLIHVKGVGGIFSSGIIAWLADPILKAEKVSSIWKYCGLHPDSKRIKGKKLDYNPRLKSFFWKIGQSFIKFKCSGRKLYNKFKEECKTKHKDWSKMHVHNYARRKVVKLFIAGIWQVWREMNNLPVTEPYPIKILGHEHIIKPDFWIEKNKGGEE